MSLRRKTLFAAAGTLVAVMLLLYVGSRSSLLQGRAAYLYYTLAPVASGVALGVMVLTVLIERVVLSRLERLSDSVTGIGLSGNLAARVRVDGDDELARLGQAINGMLEALEQSQGERQRAQTELAESSELLRSVVENIPIGIWAADRDLRLKLWNASLEQLTGARREQVLGKSALACFPRLPGVSLESLCRRVLAIGEPLTLHDCAYPDSAPPGAERRLNIRANPLKDATGQVTGIVVAVEDISERRRLEGQLRQAQKMEAMGRLAGGVAHDFNNLLTAINGYATFARDALPPESPARDDIGQVLQTAQRASDLTRQLLAFSRRQAIAPNTVNLNDLILNLSQMLRRLISENIDLTTVAAPGLRAVEVDPSQIEQVLVNLVVNAGDAMPEGGRLTIETAEVMLDEEYAGQHMSVAPGRYVMLAVSDTGCGMTDEVKARIFEPFFTTKGPGKGTGLGLATCYGIVKQNGGHIAFYSEPGHGTTFKIYFPPAAGATPTGMTTSDEPARARAARTILLVEDDAPVRAFAARGLREAGYTVAEAANGSEAMGLAGELEGAALHLLIADVVMPQVGGEELARRLRASHPGLKALFISGYTAHAVAHDDGVDPDSAFLQKPFSLADLARKVCDLLGEDSLPPSLQ